MLNRMSVFCLLNFLFISGLNVQSASAQPGPITDLEKARAKVSQIGVGREAKVEVKLRDNTKLKGYIESAAADSFVVTDSKSGTSSTVDFINVLSVNKTRRGLKPSTWIIIGAVAAAAVIISATVLYPVLCDGGAGCN